MAEALPDRPDMKTVLRAQSDRLLAEDWLQTHVAANARAAEAQVAAEVTRRTASPSEETRRFGHIFLRAAAGDTAARSRAAETMARVRKELAEGAAFDELARKYSDSITAAAAARSSGRRGGLAPEGRRGRVRADGGTGQRRRRDGGGPADLPPRRHPPPAAA
jgi:parvulin-like peptidyl-prolyl isomerase